jgi:hypothetical protein
MSGACAAKEVIVTVAVRRRWLVQRRRMTEARGGGTPTWPHRDRVAAWRAVVDGGAAGAWRRRALVRKWGAAGSGQEFGERLGVIRGHGREPK